MNPDEQCPVCKQPADANHDAFGDLGWMRRSGDVDALGWVACDREEEP